MHDFEFDSGWDGEEDIKTVHGKKGFPYDQMRKAVQVMVKKDWPCKKLVFKGRDLARKPKWVNQIFLRVSDLLKEPEKSVHEQIQDLSRLWWQHKAEGQTMEEARALLSKNFHGYATLGREGRAYTGTRIEGFHFEIPEDAEEAVRSGTHMWVNRVGEGWILLPLDFSRTSATTPKEALELLKSGQYQPVAANRSVFMVPNRGRWSYETYMKALKDRGKLTDADQVNKTKTEGGRDNLKIIGKVYVSPRIRSRPKPKPKSIPQ